MIDIYVSICHFEGYQRGRAHLQRAPLGCHSSWIWSRLSSCDAPCFSRTWSGHVQLVSWSKQPRTKSKCSKKCSKKKIWRRGQPCFWDWHKSSEISRTDMRSSTTKVTSLRWHGGVRLVMMTWEYPNIDGLPKENPVKTDDLGVPPFQPPHPEQSIFSAGTNAVD